MSHSFPAVYTVTFAPAIDYYVFCDDYRFGTVNRADGREYIAPGGKGINVSVMLKNLGIDNTALGFVAGFTGDAIESMLHAQGVKTDFIRVDGTSRINVKMRSSGIETELNGQGAHITKEAFRLLLDKLEAAEEGSWLVLAGYPPRSVPRDIYAIMLRRLAHKRFRVVADTSDDLLETVLPFHPFLVKPNREELSRFFAREHETDEELLAAARQMQSLGAQNVIVSLGGDGACMCDEAGECHRLAAPRGTFVNSIGAGDSLVAGFVAGYLYSGDYQKAFRLGVCAGSASTFTRGIATGEEVERLCRLAYPSEKCPPEKEEKK